MTDIRLGYRLLGFWMVVGSAMSAEAQCTKDTDCKGERVCEQGRCTLQTPTRAAPSSAPATPRVGQPASELAILKLYSEGRGPEARAAAEEAGMLDLAAKIQAVDNAYNAAKSERAAGRLQEAIALYESVASLNAVITSLDTKYTLVARKALSSVYEERAATESKPEAQRSLEKALQWDSGNVSAESKLRALNNPQAVSASASEGRVPRISTGSSTPYSSDEGVARGKIRFTGRLAPSRVNSESGMDIGGCTAPCQMDVPAGRFIITTGEQRYLVDVAPGQTRTIGYRPKAMGVGIAGLAAISLGAFVFIPWGAVNLTACYAQGSYYYSNVGCVPGAALISTGAVAIVAGLLMQIGWGGSLQVDKRPPQWLSVVERVRPVLWATTTSGGLGFAGSW